jgi:hypothetical protein
MVGVSANKEYERIGAMEEIRVEEQTKEERPFTIKAAALNTYCCGYHETPCGKCNEYHNCNSTLLSDAFLSYNLDFLILSEIQGENAFYVRECSYIAIPGGDFISQVGRYLGLPYSAISKVSNSGHPSKFKGIVSRYPIIKLNQQMSTVRKATVVFNPIVEFAPNITCSIYGVHIDPSEMKQLVEALEKDDSQCILAIGDYNMELQEAKRWMKNLKATWDDLGIGKRYLSNLDIDDNAGSNRTSWKNKLIDHIFYKEIPKWKTVAGFQM